MRIPYGRIRAAIARNEGKATLLLVLHDGREVVLGPWEHNGRAKTQAQRLSDIEAAINAHVAAPGSYRAPGV